MISNIELKLLKIDLMLKLFTCLTLELFEFILKFYSLKITCFFQIQCDFKIFVGFLLFTFSFEFAFFFTFFPNKYSQFFKILKKKKKKNILVGDGDLIQLFNAKFSPKLCYIYFSKKNEGKIYFVIYFQVV